APAVAAESHAHGSITIDPSPHRIDGRSDRADLALARWLLGLFLGGRRGALIGAGGRQRRTVDGIGAFRRLPGGIGAEIDRLALRVEARLRPLLRPLLPDHDIAPVHRPGIPLPPRLRPR